MTPTVRKLRELPHRHDRIEVTLSDDSVWVVRLPLLAELRLTAVGATVNDEMLGKLRHEHAVGIIERKALDMLARARRSRLELTLRLRKRGYERPLIDEALARLAAQGLVDDERVAQAEAASRLRSGAGPAKVRQLLASKGIDARMAKRAIAVAMADSGFDERRACAEVAARRLRALSGLDSEVARRRLTAFLLRRGFSRSHVSAIVLELIPRKH